MHRVSKIISGGQTGADHGGLVAAQWLGVETGGWAPKGYRTEDGPNEQLRQYGLKEMPTDSYAARTEANIRDSHGTVIFGDTNSPGSRKTLEACIAQGKPVLCIPFDGGWLFDGRRLDPVAIEKFREWLGRGGINTLNVAGNRESVSRGIYDFVVDFLVEALEEVE